MSRQAPSTDTINRQVDNFAFYTPSGNGNHNVLCQCLPQVLRVSTQAKHTLIGDGAHHNGKWSTELLQNYDRGIPTDAIVLER